MRAVRVAWLLSGSVATVLLAFTIALAVIVVVEVDFGPQAIGWLAGAMRGAR